MKRLSLLILCTFCALMTFGQETFTVSGLVNFSDGSPADQILITVLSTDDAGNLNETAIYTNPNGYYSYDVVFPSGTTQGSVEVGMQDCDNNWIIQGVTYLPGITSATIDFIYCAAGSCEVVVETIDQSGAPLPYLVAENISGLPPFSYQWSTGEITGGIFPTNSGTYCVTMTDANGCAAESCEIVTLNPPVDSCSITILVDTTTAGVVLTTTNSNSSNTTPISWQWDTGATSNALVVAQAGTYCVTVTYADGCTASDCFTYDANNNGQDTLCFVDIAEFTSPSGGIGVEVVFQTGVAPYTYYWSNGQLGTSIFPNANGEYCVTITDADGCSAVDCEEIIVVPVPDNCNTTISVIDTTSATLILGTTNSGSNVSPVSWAWDNGATTSEIAISQAGNYCVIVTYTDGCIAEDCFTYVGTNECSLGLNQIPTNTGFVHIETVQQTGVPPYSYSWDFGVIGNLVTVSESGTYCVTMTDAVGCQASNCATVVLESCSTIIQVEDGIVGVNMFTADAPFNNPPYAWSWSTGETNSVIAVVDPGTYCVTVSHEDGCESTDCYDYDPIPVDTVCAVTLTEQITPNGHLIHSDATGVAPFSYDWSNNQTTSSVVAMMSGVYCVTITDDVGCVAEACLDVVIDPDNDCDVVIIEQTNPNGVTALIAQTSNNDVQSYFWDGALSTSILQVDVSGVYCVEVIFNDGCVATACYEYVSNSVDSCSVFLTEEAGVGGIEYVVANASGIAPFTYQWSNGSIGGSIEVSPATSYCVTITDANGCEAEGCIVTSELDTFYNISGQVLYLPNTIESGMVYLIQFNEVDSTLIAIDSMTFGTAANGWTYNFTGLAAGNYLVKAGLYENSPSYTSLLPTYHINHLFWHEATEISIPYVGAASFDIQLVPGNNPGGPGFIGGYVTEGANKPDNTITDTKSPGDPMPNVSVLLLDSNDNPITHTVTNAEGRYEIDDLPYGTYKVYVEITGKDQGMQQVTLSPTTPEVDNIDFNVNSTYTTTSITEINEVKFIQLFPNPVTENEVLSVALEMTTFEELTLEIVSVNGNSLFATQENVSLGVNIIQLDMTNLASGVYFLNVKSSKGVMTRKFIR